MVLIWRYWSEAILELKNSFLALSNILRAVEGESVFGELDIESRSILTFVATNEAQNVESCVTDITGNASLPGAPATKFKRIQMLRDGGWLKAGASDLHHRRVSLALTRKAKSELDKIASALEVHLRQAFDF
jgi:hypothetical protein